MVSGQITVRSAKAAIFSGCNSHLSRLVKILERAASRRFHHSYDGVEKQISAEIGVRSLPSLCLPKTPSERFSASRPETALENSV